MTLMQPSLIKVSKVLPMWSPLQLDVSSAFRDMKVREVLGRYLNIAEGKSAQSF